MQLHVLVISFEGLIVFLLCVLIAFHVGHVAVAYFKVVFIEQLVKFVVPRKVRINLFWFLRFCYL